MPINEESNSTDCGSNSPREEVPVQKPSNNAHQTPSGSGKRVDVHLENGGSAERLTNGNSNGVNGCVPSVPANELPPSRRASIDLIVNAALSAVLAVLLAWKVLFVVDERRKRRLTSPTGLTKRAFNDRPSVFSSTTSLFSSRGASGDEAWFSSLEDFQSGSEDYLTPAMSSDEEATSEEKSARGTEDSQVRGIGHLLETDVLPVSPSPKSSTSAPPRPSMAPPAPPAPPPPPLSSQLRSPILKLSPSREFGESGGGAQMAASISSLDSPPVEIVTLGVQRDAYARVARQQQGAGEHESEEEIDLGPGSSLRGLDFDSSLEQYLLLTSAEVPQPQYGFLDAIVEEKSDELHSGPSSTRASSAQRASYSAGSILSPSVEEVVARGGHVLSREESTGESDEPVVKVAEIRATTSRFLSSLAAADDIPRLRLDDIERGEEEGAETVQVSPAEEITTSTRECRISPDSTSSDTETALVSHRRRRQAAYEVGDQPLPPAPSTTLGLRSKTPAARKMDHDQDRDQLEVLVPSDQFPCPTTPIMEEGGRVSSTSMSINLDRSRDSLLDQSICSNPRDENAAVMASSTTTVVESTPVVVSEASISTRKRKADPQSEKASSTSSDEEAEENAPLPPPPTTQSAISEVSAGEDPQASSVTAAAAAVADSVITGIEELQGGDKENVPSRATTVGTHASSRQHSEGVLSAEVKPVKQIADSTERIATFLYGYGGKGGAPSGGGSAGGGQWEGDRRVETNESRRNGSSYTRTHYTSHLRDASSPTFGAAFSRQQHPTDPSLFRTAPAYERKEAPIYQHYSHELQKHHAVYNIDGSPITTAPRYLDMDLPPQEPPPPPPLKRYAETFGYDRPAVVGDASRDDLISEGARSRSTVREIPIQRSASAFAPTSNIMSSSYETRARAFPPTGGSSIYTSSRQYQPLAAGPAALPQQEEYYRKEVLTRTLVTRSTEGLSGPPLSRSSPVERVELMRYLPEPALPPRDQVAEDYWYRYTRNVEEEERRIKANQERRRKEEEERRQREEEQRRRWEQQETDHLERLRREREMMEKELDKQMLERERLERDRIEKDRLEREAAELRRREEWERIERERRQYEEAELEKRRQLEQLEKERVERERLERERLELERLERERQEQERIEKERQERERIERERIEIERLEIERIERIRREQREQEEKEKERQREEAERLEKERQEAERLQRERLELERREREFIELQRREAEDRERERREEALREQQRRQQEERERAMLEQAEREAAERERDRKIEERLKQERMEAIRREQERLDFERQDAERRERQRQEEERRERELREAQERARERREQERIDDDKREYERREEERREAERRAKERHDAMERERQRRLEEQKERERLAALEAAAAERRAQRLEEERIQRNREDLERRAEEIKDAERREAEKRERERQEEERRLAELRDHERRNAEQRDRERREAAEREANRRQEDKRSRDRLDLIVKEREELERWEVEKRRLIAEINSKVQKEAQDRKRLALTSKETLEKLTRKPYYSRENLTGVGLGPTIPVVTSSIQPEVTTRVERQVIERVNRTLWSSDGDSAAGRYQPPPALTYSGNAHLPPSANWDMQQVSPTSEDLGGGGLNGYGRERIYNPRTADDEFRRGGSTRTSKYKQKIEKARKEFLHTDPASQYDPLSERFRKSTEDLRRRVEYRGPLLEKFHSGELRGAELGAYQPPYQPPYQQTAGYSTGYGPGPYEQEYRHLFERAERFSPAHRGRFLPDVPYNRHRHRSAGYMARGIGSTDYYPERRLLETNLDDVHRSKSVLDYNHRQSRHDGATGMEGVADPSQHQHTRSKSADYLMDRSRVRDGVAPPENELQKTIGDLHHQPGMELSEQELRFHRYREYTSGTQPTSYATDRYDPLLRTPASPPIGGISFPPGMFDKYKDEIEDVRRSRTSLHQTGATPATTPQEHTKVCVL